jgi:protocatechuate 3,4-dioxygenase beta subunit
MENAMPDSTRRNLLAGTAAGLAMAPMGAWAELLVTPSQPAGPFYPLELPQGDDNDLTRVMDQAEVAGGEVLHVAGRVLDASGTLLEGARVELWQANAEGRYHHPHDRSPATMDLGFQGFGHMVTSADGAYRFKTITPGLYPGRTRHLHFLVIAPGRAELVTQMYFAGEPDNERDGLLRRLSQDGQAAVTVPFAPTPDEPGSQSGLFDIVLG